MFNKKFISILITAILIAYPIIVYSGLKLYAPSALALLLFTLTAIKFIVGKKYKQKGQIVLFIVITLYCGLIAYFNSSNLLRYYPVLMSLGMAILFGLSLFSMPLIERFARMAGKDPSDRAKHYMRVLTKVWCTLLLMNMAVAAYTACCMSTEAWVLYNGLLSYCILLSFAGIEIIYRGFYQRKHQIET